MRIISLLALLITLGFPLTTHAQDNPDLCIRAFEDTNQNGQYDEGEVGLLGVAVFVKQGDNVVGSLTTTLDLDCLLTLEPGTYSVEFESPYQSTTPTRQSITLGTEGVVVDYGAVSSRPAAQPLGNQICVVVFEDINANGLRDEDEALIEGIDVQLTTSGVIIDTFITTDNDFSCFSGLPAGEYRVGVPPSPRHQMTTQADFAPTFIGVGTDVKAEFGAQRVNPFTADALLPNLPSKSGKIELDREMRLLLATFGATLVLLLMMGIGSIIIWLLRR